MIIPIGCQISSADYLNFKNIQIESNSPEINIFLNSHTCGEEKQNLELIVQDYHKFILELKNIFIERDAKDQYNSGVEIERIDEAAKDDLCFFGETKDTITHVGIYLGSRKIIHAFNRVRIDKLNEKGIINSETLELTHKLQGITRINLNFRALRSINFHTVCFIYLSYRPFLKNNRTEIDILEHFYFQDHTVKYFHIMMHIPCKFKF